MATVLNGRFVGEWHELLDFGGAHWKKRDNTVVRVADMDDGHLRNTLRMCDGRARAKARYGESHDAVLKKQVPGLLKEWKRRGFAEGDWR